MTTDLVSHEFVKDISKVFIIKSKLGAGAYGVVTLATNVKTGQDWALKIISLKTKIDRRQLRNEIQMLKHLQHPNIVRVTASYEDKTKMYMVMQSCGGKDLFQHLYNHRPARVFSQEEIQTLIRSLLRALAYLHSLSIVHRDLKLENLLLEDANEMTSLKVCDFGFSTYCAPGKSLSKSLGTIDYIAPEVLCNDYGSAADLWSVGVITHELFTAVSPFGGPTREATMHRILDGTLDFSLPVWDTCPLARAFVSALVVEDEAVRLTAKEALRHPWLMPSHANAPDRLHTTGREGRPSHMWQQLDPLSLGLMSRNMIHFGTTRPMKRTAMLSVALGMETQHPMMQFVNTVFHAIDVNLTGTISREEFTQAFTSLLLGFTIDRIHALFDVIDQTQTDSINYLEFLAAALDPTSITDTTLKEAFEKLDVKHTGVISKAGLTQLLSRACSPYEIQQMIDSADLNGDRCLNFNEFRHMFATSRLDDITLEGVDGVVLHNGMSSSCSQSYSSSVTTINQDPALDRPLALVSSFHTSSSGDSPVESGGALSPSTNTIINRHD